MTSIDYLSMYEIKNIKLNNLKSQLAELEERLDVIKGGFSGDEMAQYRANGGITNIPESHYLKVEKILTLIKETEEEMKFTRRNILLIIEKVQSELHKEILYDRYLKLLSWKEISEKRDIEDYILYEIHQESLALIENYIG